LFFGTGFSPAPSKRGGLQIAREMNFGMSTPKSFKVDFYIGFGKPKQTMMVQADSSSTAATIFKAMMPSDKMSSPPRV
jgi:hypothetical protein